jgi:phospholipid/cholesterol/gamma-HCH transport system substrate-binding protein
MPSSQRLQWAKVRIGSVAVTSLTILGVLVYLLSGGTWLKPKAYLETYIPDSTGLEPGSDVLLNGVEIGKVEWVKLSGSRNPNSIVEVRMKVQEEFLRHIPDDSITSLDSENLLGDKFVDITMGRSSDPVRPGGQLPYKPPGNLMQEIDLEQFEAQLRTIEQTIDDIEAGKGPLGQFVRSDQMYQQVLDGVDKLEKSLRAISDTHTKLGRFLYTAERYDDIRNPIRQLDQRLEEIQASPLLRESKQYDDIRDQLERLRQSLADLNAGKGAGGQWLSSDAAYRDWTHLLASWIESLDALTYGEGSMGRMLVTSHAYDSWTGATRSLATTLKEFREDPQKFLRIKVF